MFSRSHSKSQGYAKEKRVQEAQLSSLRELGLLGPSQVSQASGWGRETPRPTYTSSLRSYTEGPSFPEKSESSALRDIYFFYASVSLRLALQVSDAWLRTDPFVCAIKVYRADTSSSPSQVTLSPQELFAHRRIVLQLLSAR